MAGYSACLTSFTSSIRFSLHAYKEEARVKRENEFIDQELKHKAAQTDVVQSEADANRNMTEGGRDLMKSVGKAEENKSDSWFN